MNTYNFEVFVQKDRDDPNCCEVESVFLTWRAQTQQIAQTQIIEQFGDDVIGLKLISSN